MEIVIAPAICPNARRDEVLCVLTKAARQQSLAAAASPAAVVVIPYKR